MNCKVEKTENANDGREGWGWHRSGRGRRAFPDGRSRRPAPSA